MNRIAKSADGVCTFCMPVYSYILPVIRHPACDSSGDIVAVGGEEVYVCAVDEAGFDEDGGHSGVAEDAEGGMGFDAAVFVACVKGGKAFYQLVLEAGRQSSARAALFVAVGFCAPPAAGVDVDAEEDIGGPVVGRVHDARIAGGLAVEVMALEEPYGAACRLQVFTAEGAIGQRQVTFAQGQGGIYAAGVGGAAEGVAGIDKYAHGTLLSLVYRLAQIGNNHFDDCLCYLWAR